MLGVNLNDKDGYYYMVSDCEHNELFERYTNSIVGDSFIDIAEKFSDRLKEQIEKVKATEKDMPVGFITADMCDTASDRNYNGEIIVIKADVLCPEYQTQAHQIMRCTGGNGANYTAIGRAVFCDNLYTGKSSRFERYDILGVLKPEHYPKWLNEKLKYETAIKENRNVFQYGDKYFLPVGIISKSYDMYTATKLTATDKELGFWRSKYENIYGKPKTEYNYKEFYDACGNIKCDVFMCLENGKHYMPAENELFEYKGSFDKYKKQINGHIAKKQKSHKEAER